MNKRRIFACISVITLMLLILTLGIYSTQKTADTPDRLLSLGEKYLTELNYEQALVQFLKVIEIDPMNPRGYTGAAEAYVGLDRTNDAIEILRRGLDLLPQNYEIQNMMDRIEAESIVKNIPESALSIDSVLEPEQTLPPVSTSPVEQRAVQLDITEFSYSNLSYSFEWLEGFSGNENAVGGCWLEYQLEGDLTNAVTTRIAYGAPKNDWTLAAIYEHTEYITQIWKSGGDLGDNGPYDGYVKGCGFPINEDELGVTGDVLCLVLDRNCDAIGYVLIPVTIPLR